MSASFQVDLLSNVQEKEVLMSERIVRLVKLPNEEKAKGCIVPIVSTNQASLFAAQYPDVVAYAMEQLQNKVIRNLWITSKRSPNESDLSFDSLYAAWQAEEKEERLTKESIKTAWAGALGLSFVNYLGTSRKVDLSNADNVAMLTGVKQNYLGFVQMAAERKPSFDTAGIKEKVTLVITGFAEYLEKRGEQSVIVLKALEKMLDAVVTAVDESAL